jgi:hypothetical protein
METCCTESVVASFCGRDWTSTASGKVTTYRNLLPWERGHAAVVDIWFGDLTLDHLYAIWTRVAILMLLGEILQLFNL